jgi:hypothetical protein
MQCVDCKKEIIGTSHTLISDTKAICSSCFDKKYGKSALGIKNRTDKNIFFSKYIEDRDDEVGRSQIKNMIHIKDYEKINSLPVQNTIDAPKELKKKLSDFYKDVSFYDFKDFMVGESDDLTIRKTIHLPSNMFSGSTTSSDMSTLNNAIRSMGLFLSTVFMVFYIIKNLKKIPDNIEKEELDKVDKFINIVMPKFTRFFIHLLKERDNIANGKATHISKEYEYPMITGKGIKKMQSVKTGKMYNEVASYITKNIGLIDKIFDIVGDGIKTNKIKDVMTLTKAYEYIYKKYLSQEDNNGFVDVPISIFKFYNEDGKDKVAIDKDKYYTEIIDNTIASSVIVNFKDANRGRHLNEMESIISKYTRSESTTEFTFILSNSIEEKMKTYEEYKTCQSPTYCKNESSGFYDLFVDADTFIVRIDNYRGNIEGRVVCHRYYSKENTPVFFMSRLYRYGQICEVGESTVKTMIETIFSNELKKKGAYLYSCWGVSGSSVDPEKIKEAKNNITDSDGFVLSRPRMMYNARTYYNESNGESHTSNLSPSFDSMTAKLDTSNNTIDVLNVKRTSLIILKDEVIKEFEKNYMI